MGEGGDGNGHGEMKMDVEVVRKSVLCKGEDVELGDDFRRYVCWQRCLLKYGDDILLAAGH